MRVLTKRGNRGNAPRILPEVISRRTASSRCSIRRSAFPLPETVAGFPFLVYDGNDFEKRPSLRRLPDLRKECPPKCIYIVKSKDKKPDYIGKPQFYPAIFDIDLSV